MKTAAVRGRPFQEGVDARRGRGPRKGAANAGRPPNEFKAQLAALASREETIRALAAILEDPNHPHFIQALKFAADRGYGRPTQPLEVGPAHPTIVLVAPEKLSTEAWVERYSGWSEVSAGSVDPTAPLRLSPESE